MRNGSDPRAIYHLILDLVVCLASIGYYGLTPRRTGNRSGVSESTPRARRGPSCQHIASEFVGVRSLITVVHQMNSAGRLIATNTFISVTSKSGRFRRASVRAC